MRTTDATDPSARITAAFYGDKNVSLGCVCCGCGFGLSVLFTVLHERFFTHTKQPWEIAAHTAETGRAPRVRRSVASPLHIMLSIGILPSSGFGQGSAVGLRAASLRSVLRPAMSADDALGNQFWSSKTAATRFKLNLELSALDEMQEREQMFMTFLQKESENTRLLEAQLEETKRQLSAAPVAPALAAAESPAAALAPAGTAANADEVTSLKAELKSKL